MKTPFCKNNNQLSGYGLKKIIELLPSSILSRSCRNILACVCEVAASSSEYKLFKSKRRMAQEAGVSVATIRRNLDLAVASGILHRHAVFDETRGQCPTEYQFSAAFLEMAKSACQSLASKARDRLAQIEVIFCEFALFLTASNRRPGLRITNSIKSRKNINLEDIPPDQNAPPPPDQIDLQCSEVRGVKKIKRYSTCGENHAALRKTLKQAQAERQLTRAKDLVERKNAEYAQRGHEQLQIDKEVRRRHYLTIQRPQRSFQTTYNASRFAAESKKADDALLSAQDGFQRACENGFNPLDFVENLRKKFRMGRSKCSTLIVPEPSSPSGLQRE